MLTVGSLFSGIGGLDLGLERAGMKVIWNSEIDPYACRVLKKHWPEVPNVGDIKQVDWADVARPDVICGGYPCQPFSTAGKRQGEEDPRHLWPWVREAIRVLRPRYAILENVRGHLSLGGATVISEIAALGYCAEWRIVSAASVGANHRRERIIIVAYPDSSYPSNGRQREALPGEDRGWGNDRGGSDGDPRQITFRGTREDPSSLAHTNHSGSRAPERRMVPRKDPVTETLQDRTAGPFDGTSGRCTNVANPDRGRLKDVRHAEVYGPQGLSAALSDSTRRSIANWWTTEPNVGRVANGIPHRVDRLRGLGNAVVPQVAEIIGRLVIQHHQTTQKDPDQ